MIVFLISILLNLAVSEEAVVTQSPSFDSDTESVESEMSVFNQEKLTLDKLEKHQKGEICLQVKTIEPTAQELELQKKHMDKILINTKQCISENENKRNSQKRNKAMDCLLEGYSSVPEMKPLVKKIMNVMRGNRDIHPYKKLSLERSRLRSRLFAPLLFQNVLRDLGWKNYYWNVDAAKNREVDTKEKNYLDMSLQNFKSETQDVKENSKRFKAAQSKMESVRNGTGYHEANYNVLKKNNCYEGVKVDDKDMLVGSEAEVNNFLKKIPYSFGTANGGYHFFSTQDGTVYQRFGATKFPISKPIGDGGGVYLSGLISVPPQ